MQEERGLFPWCQKNRGINSHRNKKRNSVNHDEPPAWEVDVRFRARQFVSFGFFF